MAWKFISAIFLCSRSRCVAGRERKARRGTERTMASGTLRALAVKQAVGIVSIREHRCRDELEVKQKNSDDSLGQRS